MARRRASPFRRLIFQTAIAYKFGCFLTKPKEAEILALAKELSPAPDGDEAKVTREEMIVKATVYYDFTSPVVASKTTTIRLLIPP
jgi:hypothetical protein